jgi:cytochrome c556
MNMKTTLQRLTLSTLLTLTTLPVFATDARTIVWLSEEEQTLLLSEMRQFLVASQKILAASLKNDMETVEATARNVGIQQMRSTPDSLRAKLPKGFKALGPKVHRGFEDIANEAETLGDSTVILKRLAQLQKNCIACHAAYRVKAATTLTEK